MYFLHVFLHHLHPQEKDRQAAVEDSQRYSVKISIAVMSCIPVIPKFWKVWTYEAQVQSQSGEWGDLERSCLKFKKGWRGSAMKATGWLQSTEIKSALSALSQLRNSSSDEFSVTLPTTQWVLKGRDLFKFTFRIASGKPQAPSYSLPR